MGSSPTLSSYLLHTILMLKKVQISTSARSGPSIISLGLAPPMSAIHLAYVFLFPCIASIVCTVIHFISHYIFYIMLTSSFSMGQVVATASIQSLMTSDLSFHTFIYTCLMRHEVGDWGEVCEEDHESNELALVSSHRLFSVYHCSAEHSVHGDRIYIITEADRSATTVLWPSEY
jgi:hypothetical protein